MTQFKEALECYNSGFEGDPDFLDFAHGDTIRLALKIADAIKSEPMSKAMYMAGEKAQTEGFVIQNPARIFQAMIEQMMRESEPST